eukprot:366239-Chlamydomonas_euryale.AAC.9
MFMWGRAWCTSDVPLLRTDGSWAAAIRFHCFFHHSRSLAAQPPPPAVALLRICNATGQPVHPVVLVAPCVACSGSTPCVKSAC